MRLEITILLNTLPIISVYKTKMQYEQLTLLANTHSDVSPPPSFSTKAYMIFFLVPNARSHMCILQALLICAITNFSFSFFSLYFFQWKVGKVSRSAVKTLYSLFRSSYVNYWAFVLYSDLT